MDLSQFDAFVQPLKPQRLFEQLQGGAECGRGRHAIANGEQKLVQVWLAVESLQQWNEEVICERL